MCEAVDMLVWKEGAQSFKHVILSSTLEIMCMKKTWLGGVFTLCMIISQKGNNYLYV